MATLFERAGPRWAYLKEQAAEESRAGLVRRLGCGGDMPPWLAKSLLEAFMETWGAWAVKRRRAAGEEEPPEAAG